eukprot:3061566-Rhodomonas_salina.1
MFLLDPTHAGGQAQTGRGSGTASSVSSSMKGCCAGPPSIRDPNPETPDLIDHRPQTRDPTKNKTTRQAHCR